MKTALVTGISGQDGAYLSQLLLEKGYRVIGQTRGDPKTPIAVLEALGLGGAVEICQSDLDDADAAAALIASCGPDEIYHLAGQSSVGKSFAQPAQTIRSLTLPTLNLLEALRLGGTGIRLFCAGSGEVFGDTGGEPANEATPFRPVSPYGAAKAAAFWQIDSYRRAYGLFACTGLLYNHESPLRDQQFVTRRIVAGACAIAAKRAGTLELGDLSVARDWGWAPDYVEAMWLMLQLPAPDDFIIATGRTITLQDFVARSFAALGLDWSQHVVTMPGRKRPLDIAVCRADAGKADRALGWTARHGVDDVIKLMIAAEGMDKTSGLG